MSIGESRAVRGAMALVAFMGISAVSAAQPAAPQRAEFTHGGVTRSYLVVTPVEPSPPASRSLLLMLHGCTQDAADAARGTQLHVAAASAGMTTVYAEQPVASHPQRCWNWYVRAQTTRGAGEVDFLAALARRVAAEQGIPGARIVVAGISAGGAMAANLLYAYPDVFRAAAVHSGVAAFAARDLTSGLAAMRGGPPPLDALVTAALEAAPEVPIARVALLAIHGDTDAVVSPANLDALLAQAIGVATRRAVPVQTERLLIPGLGHAWSGGSREGTFTDPSREAVAPRVVQFLRARLDER
ncbi:MAG: PHB depolymerase family esterase [Gemmatimonadaceae bacterium]|nr:PHB depolymerase family esterase [Gemmatimonadaceae bacterium]